EVDDKAGTVRLVLLDGEAVGRGEVRAWGCDGPYDVTFSRDAVVGRSDGLGRFLSVTAPPGLSGRSMLLLAGEPYSPGVAPGQLIVPLMPGPHALELRTLPQPPVFRSWQMW